MWSWPVTAAEAAGGVGGLAAFVAGALEPEAGFVVEEGVQQATGGDDVALAG